MERLEEVSLHEAIYRHLAPESNPSAWTEGRPFNAVVVATCPVSAEWQEKISYWLVRAGCLYMMAWGENCSSWDDSVDRATRMIFEPSEIPDDRFVMTTWHTNETLENVFWQAQFVGSLGYDDQELRLTLVLDIGENERSSELLALFKQAADLHDREG